MSDGRLPQSIAGFAIGFGVGAALGILFAPKSGEETREYLLEGAKDAVDDAVRTGQKFTKRAKRAVNEAAERVREATQAGERTYREARSA
jgi:gas vesicle protein